MELDIRNLSPYDTATMARDHHQKILDNSAAQKIRAQQVAKVEENIREKLVKNDNVDGEKYLQDILNMTEIFNRKLKFSIARELDKVIVKVVDSQTDKVIKEIPPKELIRLYSSLKKAIGLLVDEQI